MRLLDRYLLREFLIPLAYCLCGFLVLFDTFQLFSELPSMQEKKLHAGDILEYYFFKTPEFLITVLPVALLLALLYALTNHSRHNEITAMRAAGVSLWRLCLPYFVVGSVCSVALFAWDEFCAPRASEIAEQILTRRTQKFTKAPERELVQGATVIRAREGRFWHIAIYNRLTGEMINPEVQWDLPDGSIRYIKAERAVRTNNVWTFYHAQVSTQVSLANVLPPRKPSTNTLAFPEFTETPAEIKSEITINEILESKRRTKRADISIRELMNYFQLHPRPDRSIRPKLYTKLHGRIAGPCACLVVVLVAIPFAVIPGRRNVLVSVAASITIFFVYYFLQQLGFALGETGHLPPWFAAWCPNLLFGTLALLMMAKVR